MKTGHMLKVVALALVLVLSDMGAVIAAPPARLLPSARSSEETALAAETIPGLRVVESKKDHIILELSTPDFRLEQDMAEDGPCDLITVADYGETGESGWPRLPVQGAMVGIPPQADVSLTVLEAEAVAVPGSFNLCPVPQPIVNIDASGNVLYAGEVSIKSPEAYADDGFYPASEAEIASTGFIRSQRVAQLQFHPFQYTPVSGLLRHLTRIQVRLEFNSQDVVSLDAAAGPVDDEGTFEAILSQTLVNYQEAQQWRTAFALAPQFDALPTETQLGYKILVDEDGVYELGYDDLLAAGADVGSLDPCTLRLHNLGEESAIYVEGEADGSFDPGDYILFYGQKMDSRHTDINVYWLTWGGAEGGRMEEIDGTPTGTAAVPAYFLTTHHAEVDGSYQSFYTAGPDDDHWIWDGVWAMGAPATNSYVITQLSPVTVPLSATVRGFFRGFDTSQSHRMQVYLNGHLINDATWALGSKYSFEASVPQSYLLEGQNVITVTAGVGLSNPAAFDYIFVNWFEIDYYASYAASENLFAFDGDQAGTWEYQATGFTTDTLGVLDITTPNSPVRIQGVTAQDGDMYTISFQHTITEKHSYLALAPGEWRTPLRIERDNPSTLASTANGADYIIITYGDFVTASLSLADYRATQGLRTAVVDVQNVYDEFSYGVFEPEAIRDFLTYAYTNWQKPAPTYVLLMGDGNYDPKNNYGTGEPSFIPPYLVPVDRWIGEAAADNRYVCVAGDDIFPDMHLGRLPVKTSAEADAVVAKIIGYEQNPPTDEWNRQVLFVADNPDSSGDFYAYSDAIADYYLPAPYTVQKIYYGVAPYTSSAATRSAIIAAINDGRLVVNYVGHGATEYWATEQLFRSTDAPALTNAGRLPLMVAMACLDGNYIRPSPSTRDRSATAESIVRTPTGGAIASWSATGLGLASIHDLLNKGLFEAIFFDGVVELGPATTQGKLYLYSRTSGHGDQIDEYTLFGDPALRLNVAHGSYASSVTGNWHASSTWGGGAIPVASDVVTITTGTTVTIDSDTKVYRLTIESGGTLEIPNGATLNVTDSLVNNGTLRQVQDVTGSSDVAFLDVGGYGGVVINANGQALGNTLVEIKGNQDCEGTADEAVSRCFEISPANTSGLSATVTFYFDSSDMIGGSQCGEKMKVYHYHAGLWQPEIVSAWECSSSLYSITATGVSSFSPFVLKNEGGATAVDLVYFTAKRQDDAILLAWETATEVNNVGFNLYRSTSAEGPYDRLNAAFISSQSPGSALGATYTWLDEDVQLGITYYYKLEDVEAGGARTMYGPISASTQNPTKLTLVSFETQRGNCLVAVMAGVLFLGTNGLIVIWGRRSKPLRSLFRRLPS